MDRKQETAVNSLKDECSQELVLVTEISNTILLTTSQSVTKPAFPYFNSCNFPYIRFEFEIKKQSVPTQVMVQGMVSDICLSVSSQVTTRHNSLAFSAFQKTVMLTWSYSTIHKLISDRNF